jgi:hypothetical protein
MVILEKLGCLRSHFSSVPGDENDRNGIDAGFVTERGVEILFQVKSSSIGVQKHFRKHPNIPCLNLHACRSISDVVVLIQDQFLNA